VPNNPLICLHYDSGYLRDSLWTGSKYHVKEVSKPDTKILCGDESSPITYGGNIMNMNWIIIVVALFLAVCAIGYFLYY
jgi:hypothetical protein